MQTMVSVDSDCGVLTLDITVTENNIENDAKRILQHIRPSWNQDDMRFKVFTDGITNKLLGCYQKGDFDNMILVRVNGEGSEMIIDRDAEHQTFQILAAANCAPPLHCMFNNGIAYGFFPGLPLDEESVRVPKIQRLIAEEIVRYHSACKKCDGKQAHTRSQYRDRMQHWINITPTHFDDPVKQEIFEKEIPSRDELQKELSEIVDNLESLNMKIVFSHNDLLLKNIIYNKKEETVHFIDYEYAFYNYEAYDIGDHFAEYAGMDEVNYDLYPSKEEQLPWLRHYLESKAKSEGKLKFEITDKDVEKLYVQTNKCACAAHFYWGVWALLQAEHSVIDFDYVRYAGIRLAEYFRRKKEFFPLTA
uniref:ethanolamine kinase n=2 Tax=Arion vulgaris TaxID=1028688 RepID=A0A0B7AJ87_9EUPU